MNFKPTLWKSIISIIGGLPANYYLADMATFIVCDTAEDCSNLPTWIDYSFTPVPLLAAIITMIIIYSVWSLLQKK